MNTPAPPTWTLRPHAPPSGTVLDLVSNIPQGGAKEYRFGVGINIFRMFVVRHGTAIVGYLNLCPHYSLPLNHAADEFLTRDRSRIMCRQHLALFAIDTGHCLDGACEGRSLEAIALRIENGTVSIA